MKTSVSVPFRERKKGFFANLLKIWHSTTITFPDIVRQIIDTTDALEYTQFIGVMVTIDQLETELSIHIEYYYKQAEVAKKYDSENTYPMIMQIPLYLSSELETSRKIKVSFEETDLLVMKEDLKAPVHRSITMGDLLKLLNTKFSTNIIKISIQDMIFYTKVIVETNSGQTWQQIYTCIDNLPAKCADTLIKERIFSINL
ncbi:MAG: hypothetical protein IJ838_02205 [Paludibacteraceae bacterium]|nr:hypothetical protein [Paludibacteraceae bacterium]